MDLVNTQSTSVNSILDSIEEIGIYVLTDFD